MTKTLATLMLALPLSLCSSGCTDSSETTSVTADAKKSAIEEYQAMIVADEAAMNAAAPPDIKVAPSAGAGKAAAPAAGKAAAPAAGKAAAPAAGKAAAPAAGKAAAPDAGKSAAPARLRLRTRDSNQLDGDRGADREQWSAPCVQTWDKLCLPLGSWSRASVCSCLACSNRFHMAIHCGHVFFPVPSEDRVVIADRESQQSLSVGASPL